MNRLVELHRIYMQELQEIRHHQETEKEALMYMMREALQNYDAEKRIIEKLESIEREMTSEFTDESCDDR